MCGIVQYAGYFIARLKEYGRSRPLRLTTGIHMKYATPEDELIRLRKQQSKTRQDEVFGGLSPEERTTYDIRENRIHELDRDLPERLYRRLRKAS